MATPTTLPASFTAGQVLTAAQMNDLRGAFRILQVVQGSYATQATNSTSTLADTGLTATITPTSATSKVLVVVDQAGLAKSSGNSNNALRIGILRGSTVLTYFVEGAGYTATNLQLFIGSASASYLDSPATTSATTYKTQFSNIGVAAANVSVQTTFGTTPTSYITLFEVSA